MGMILFSVGRAEGEYSSSSGCGPEVGYDILLSLCNITLGLTLAAPLVGGLECDKRGYSCYQCATFGEEHHFKIVRAEFIICL